MSLEALKRNGHNLELGAFDRAGEYGIPVLQPVQLDKRLDWVRFNHALHETHRDRYGVQFFIDDYLFQRAWHDPPRYALFLRQFPAVMTPDFSMFVDYPKAVQIYNHWRKHQLGAYWQRVGMTVVPTIGWIDEDSYEWCFDGEPEGSTVAVSSVGTQKNQEARRLFLAGYKEMLIRLQPRKIIFFGDVPDECQGNIEQHDAYYHTFTKGLSFADKAR